MKKPVLDHVAVAAWKFEDAVPVVVGELGGRPGPGGPGAGLFWGTWVFQNGGALEIIEPRGEPDGFLFRFLRSRGPGVHHVTFKFPSLREACDHAETAGYEIVGFNDSNPMWKEAFLHPRQALGVVVQLVETPPDFDAGVFEWEPPSTPDPLDPVNLVGLRMVAPSAEAARHLWETTLLGETHERPGELIFHWPDSPLRISVALDGSRPPGPVALEIETDREIPLLDKIPPGEFGASIVHLK